jgi:hypothetical protein
MENGYLERLWMVDGRSLPSGLGEETLCLVSQPGRPTALSALGHAVDGVWGEG